MPFDVTMEKPDSRVIGFKTDGSGTSRRYHDCVTTNGIDLRLVDRYSLTSVLIFLNDLELVSVKLSCQNQVRYLLLGKGRTHMERM